MPTSQVSKPATSVQEKLQRAEPNHKPELDGIRGIAVLAVMLSHISIFIRMDSLVAKLAVYCLAPGWAGVELFFVLSGFLITGILLRTKKAQNYFSAFYMRRFLRIFPIYYFVLIVGIFAASKNAWWKALLPPLKTRIAYFFYLQNVPYFWPHHIFQKANLFGHFWSLAVEEQFYIVWPVLVLLIPEGMILWLCSGLLIALIPLRFYVVFRYVGDFTAMAVTTSRMDGLLIGAILAVLLYRGAIPLRWTWGAIAAGMCILGYIVIFHHYELIATAYYMPIIGVTGFSLLGGGLVALSQHPIAGLNRMLSASWLRLIGRYSYGMYVYHIPIYAMGDYILVKRYGVRFPFSLHTAALFGVCMMVVTFVIAKLSYDLFESRLLALKVHFKPRYPMRDASTV